MTRCQPSKLRSRYLGETMPTVVSSPYVSSLGNIKPQLANSVMKPYRTTHKNEHRKAHRDGFTLIEMLIVITIFVFLLASAAMAIGTLFRAQGDLQDELIEANTASRLASQLRCDAHLANSAELTRDGDTTSLRLLLPNTEISYVAHARRIIRTVNQSENETHREVFSLLEGTTTEWEITGENPAFITLTTSFVSPALRESIARPRVHRVETSIGLHAGGAR